MCCLFSVLVFLGPRFGLIFWYLYQPGASTASSMAAPRCSAGSSLPDDPHVGFGGRGGVSGIDWLWIALGVLADVSTYAGGGWRNKDQINTYAGKHMTR